MDTASVELLASSNGVAPIVNGSASILDAVDAINAQSITGMFYAMPRSNEDMPSTGSYYTICMTYGSSYAILYATQIVGNATNIYVRQKTSGTWNDWSSRLSV